MTYHHNIVLGVLNCEHMSQQRRSSPNPKQHKTVFMFNKKIAVKAICKLFQGHAREDKAFLIQTNRCPDDG